MNLNDSKFSTEDGANLFSYSLANGFTARLNIAPPQFDRPWDEVCEGQSLVALKRANVKMHSSPGANEQLGPDALAHLGNARFIPGGTALLWKDHQFLAAVDQNGAYSDTHEKTELLQALNEANAVIWTPVNRT